MSYVALPWTWDTAKTRETESYCHTLLKGSTPLRSVYGNARGCPTNLDSFSIDRVANLAKLIPNYRMPLKKLLPVDERPRRPALLRGRGPLTEAQQSDTDVGAQGTTATRALPSRSRQSRLLRGTLPQNGGTADQRSSHFQHRDLCDFIRYLLQSTQGKIYLILDNARWHKARSLRELFYVNRDRILRIFLPPYSHELNPVERVWRITRRQVAHNRKFQSNDVAENSPIIHLFKLGATEHHTSNIMCKYLRHCI